MGYILFGAFFLLMLIGVPIGLAIGLSALIVFVSMGIPLQMVPQTLLEGNNSFALVAVPFFVLAGDILAKGGISERIVAFAEAALGGIRGGLSVVSVLASMFIAAISGSGAATTAAVGASLLPDMKAKGYDVADSAALIAAAGTIGVVIPPSVPMVLYAVISGESVAKLFVGGFIPGTLMGLGLIGWALYKAKKQNYSRGSTFPLREVWKKFLDAFWGLLAPVIILGGIFSGIFTPSEAAAVAVVYSVFVAVFIYKGLNFKKFYELVIGIIILLAGMFMETASALIILTPIFLPVVTGVGGSLPHFDVVLTIGLAIGMATPPVAIDIYVASAITGLPMGKIARPIVPMVGILMAVFFLVMYLPDIVLALPRWFMGSV